MKTATTKPLPKTTYCYGATATPARDGRCAVAGFALCAHHPLHRMAA